MGTYLVEEGVEGPWSGSEESWNSSKTTSKLKRGLQGLQGLPLHHHCDYHCLGHGFHPDHRYDLQEHGAAFDAMVSLSKKLHRYPMKNRPWKGSFIWWSDGAPTSQTHCLSTTCSTSTTTTAKVNNQKLFQKKNFVILHVLLTICLICQSFQPISLGNTR